MKFSIKLQMLIHFLQQKARADNKETKSQLFKTGKTLRRSVDPF